MKRLAIFSGPSLYGVEFPRLESLESWFPPVGHNDISSLVERGGFTHIVLIDGVFHQRLSVWHKELLLALGKGIKVIGASSMGALRAAELDRYGAVGIGKIYQAYKSGRVTSDAWVAMSFDPGTMRPLTLPPCGMKQKQLDAIEAIKYAREN
jgi:hypothetical protein